MPKSNDLTLTLSHCILQIAHRRLHSTYYSFNIINCRLQFDDLSLQFAGYSLLFAGSQLHESLQDEVCILPFLDISLKIVVAVFRL